MNRMVAVKYGEDKFAPAVLSDREGVACMVRFGIKLKRGGEGIIEGEDELAGATVHLMQLPGGNLMCYLKSE